MRKAQSELPLKTIVIGVLVLIVFLILGALIVTRALGIDSILLGIQPEAEAVSYTSVLSDCYSKCRVMENIVDFNYASMTQEDIAKIPTFCCAGGDFNSDGWVGDDEICASLYQDCVLNTLTPRIFCKGAVTIEGVPQPVLYDFTVVKDFHREGCGETAFCQGDICLCCDKTGQAAIALSCPFIYTYNGKDWSFEHESYGFAVVKEWEYETYETLNNLNLVNNTLMLQLREELPETSYTNKLSLKMITHPVDTIIMPDINGKIHTIKKPESYTNLTAELNDYTESRIFAFKKKGSSPKLLLQTRESGLIRESALKLVNMIGSNNLDDFYKLASYEPVKTIFKNWREEIAEAKVSALIDNEWVLVSSFGVGGAKWNSIVIELPDTNSEYYYIKIDNTVKAYEFKSVMMDFSEQENITLTELEPKSLPAELLHDDNTYLTLEQGEAENITFKGIECPADQKCSYTASIKGYYHIYPPVNEVNMTIPLLLNITKFLLSPEKTLEYCLLK